MSHDLYRGSILTVFFDISASIDIPSEILDACLAIGLSDSLRYLSLILGSEQALYSGARSALSPKDVRSTKL